jgi:hypothetical protein
MTVETGLRTSAQLLYLAIDLDEEPGFGTFAEQVEAVDRLQRHCALLYPTYISPQRRGDDPNPKPPARLHYRDESVPASQYEINVIRTSMASPWVTVLTEVAKSSAPVAYGVGALFALQKLMQMVMEWQNHRQALTERREKVDLEAAMEIVNQHRAEVTPNVIMAGDDVWKPANAIRNLDRVNTAEMITPDDPRARGVS